MCYAPTQINAWINLKGGCIVGSNWWDAHGACDTVTMKKTVEHRCQLLTTHVLFESTWSWRCSWKTMVAHPAQVIPFGYAAGSLGSSEVWSEANTRFEILLKRLQQPALLEASKWCREALGINLETASASRKFSSCSSSLGDPVSSKLKHKRGSGKTVNSGVMVVPMGFWDLSTNYRVEEALACCVQMSCDSAWSIATSFWTTPQSII